jgi:NAD(P)-dependent dehydrogenase (short-subunit alcohol dehydrogenase family)
MTDMRQFDLQDKVALVTGGGHGIGAGIVETLAAGGARVIVNDLIDERASATALRVTGAGGEALGIAADVSTVEDVHRLMTSSLDAFGRIDILVNNAAIFCNKAFLDHTVEEWDRLISVNLRGVFLCTRAVLPGMIERSDGNIVNIASISAFNTTTEHVAYAASKAAIVTLTRDVAAEVAQFGVRVNAVAPGPIDSRLVHSEPFAGILLHRIGTPADIGNAVAFLVSDGARFITGETLRVAGGSDLKVDR